MAKKKASAKKTAKKTAKKASAKGGKKTAAKSAKKSAKKTGGSATKKSATRGAKKAAPKKAAKKQGKSRASAKKTAAKKSAKKQNAPKKAVKKSSSRSKAASAASRKAAPKKSAAKKTTPKSTGKSAAKPFAKRLVKRPVKKKSFKQQITTAVKDAVETVVDKIKSVIKPEDANVSDAGSNDQSKQDNNSNITSGNNYREDANGSNEETSQITDDDNDGESEEEEDDEEEEEDDKTQPEPEPQPFVAHSTGLKEGMEAPYFEGRDQNGNMVRSSDLRGKTVILYFYPKDDTPGCTAESCSLRDEYQYLNNNNYAVVGVSADNEESHAKFSKKYDLPFPLIADTERKIINDYDVFGKKQLAGNIFDGIVRTTFIIDPEGIIKNVITKVDTEHHAKQILDLH